MATEIPFPSPNTGPRPAGVRPQYVILHYTGMLTCEAALQRLCDEQAKVSCHLLIDEDGLVYRLVADHLRAWHAGVSYWRGERDLNSLSIGIELVNPGHEHGYRSFPDPQVQSLCTVLSALMDRHGIPPTGVLGHSDIAPLRKEDPGELFPWAVLAAQGLAVAPPETLPLPTGPGDDVDLRAAARAVGFEAPEDIPEAQHLAIRTAAQRRLTPQEVGQQTSPTLLARMRWWADQLNS